MLESIKRLFAGTPSQAGWEACEQWALARGHVFKRTRDSGGFVVEAQGEDGWRLEWGPSQRDYITGGELRLRAELRDGPELQLLVVSRLLMEALERQVFEEFTEGTQTRIDTATPEEMRWLVMFPKVTAAESKELREHYGAVGNLPEALPAWLNGALTVKLLEAARTWLAREDRLVLIVQRGRLTLRTAMPQPEPARIEAVAALFDVALAESRRVMRHFNA
jgi:hypothetical protein